MSPFIKELDESSYHSVDNNFVEVKTGIVSSDVNNYLRLTGYSKIQKLYQTLNCQESNLGFHFDIELKNSGNLVGNFMDYLLCKIIHINFPSLVVKFDLPLKHKDSSFPNNIYHKYIDKLEDWRMNFRTYIFHSNI